MTIRKSAVVLCPALFAAAGLIAQTVTGSLVGTLVDPTGAVVPNVQVKLTNQGTAAVNMAASDNDGLFRFPNLNAGTYSVTVQAPGFKTWVETGIVLGLSDNRNLGRLTLEVGSVNEQIAVTAEVTPVQTTTAERSAVVDGNQLNSEAIRGREMMSYMRMLPGVVDTTVGRDATGGAVLGGLSFNGSTGITGFMVDGIPDMDTGCSNCFTHFEPNIDAIGEVKVLTSNYQAEFGRNAGGSIQVVTKSGTQQFHGSGWWTHRHEEFNANDFFNNVTGLPKSRYRYNIAGWSLGGPIFIPHHFNIGKTKLFFFASQEFTQQLATFNNQYRTMPTALERTGDFSQSLNSGGQLIAISDPLSLNAAGAATPFPGNVIPQNRINGWGQAILNFFPLPTTVFAKGTAQYLQDNFQAAGSASHPRRNDIVRLDINLTSKLTGYLRWGHDADDWVELFQSSQFLKGPTGDLTQDHPAPGHGILGSLNYVASPTLVNQFTYSKTLNHWSWFEVDPAAVSRDVLKGTSGTPQAGQPLPSLFPLHQVGPGVGGSQLVEGAANASNGYANYMPYLNFGNPTPNTPTYSNGNPEYSNNNIIDTATDNISKVWGNHSLKGGVYVEFNRKIQPCGAAGCNGYVGNYSFGVDVNNPLNTGNSFANALLGYYGSYNEWNAKIVVNDTFWNVEFYVQDNWRVSKRLTLDYGMRFYHQTPEVDKQAGNQFAYFNPALYNPAQAPRYYVPAMVGGKRVALDPATGNTAGVAAIGLFVPNSGNPADGFVVAGSNGVAWNTYNTSPIAYAPRVGFAYDVFGNGKTAIRGGVGVFYDRLDGNQVYSMASNPPVVYAPTAYYGQITSLATAGGLLGPQTITQWAGHTVLPSERSASLGVQQSVGFGAVLDVSYQGTFGLNRNVYENMNAIPIGADFQPQFTDPTTGRPLPSALERTAYPSLGTLNQFVFNGKSNYHSMQATLRKRLSHGLLFGVAYTWSRAMQLLAFDPLVANNYSRNYGPQGIDRRQTIGINYVYDIPKPGQALHNKVLTIVADGWQLSGITTANSGYPFTPGLSTTNSEDITGSANETARIDVIGDPYKNIPPPANPSVPNHKLAFNPNAFAVPAVGTIGNAGGGAGILYGPGWVNFDAALTRSIPLGNEQRQLRFRLDAFNVFNHTEFNGVASGFNFNPATGQNITANVGQYTSDRGPRILSLELRFQF